MVRAGLPRDGGLLRTLPPAFSPNNRDYIIGSLLPAWNAPDSWQLARTAPAAQTICGLV